MSQNSSLSNPTNTSSRHMTSTLPKNLPRKVFHTALCVIPPLHLWPVIQAHRSIYDTSFHRWMPHFNICFPFIAENHFDSIRQALQAELQNMEPFEMKLGREVRFFEKGQGKKNNSGNEGKHQMEKKQRKQQGKTVMWIQPMAEEDALDRLMKSVLQVVPHCNEAVKKAKDQHVVDPDATTELGESESPFRPASIWHPHITLGRPSNDRSKQHERQSFESQWKKLSDEDVTFTCSEICMIMREGKEGAMQVKHRIGLGGGEQAENRRIQTERLRAPDMYDAGEWENS
eukprot:CAMPEP_0117443602 /NCGR_PEP_ID=MMETSP0759-20121206/4779_1 /TAXON_ID=63605 /ORGANISM="Percolomonas cosmopolitus, Strain WS" /LENGTH=286 /DNA_ID=CAMNT_0005235581 /DNA_START=340 /DNA_END=1200 /DNA_ORIENTATION=+